MDALEFLKERKRMCDSFISCRSCLIKEEKKGFACGFWIFSNAEKAIAIVENWSKEHPRKTILMDFLEKYPNAPLDERGTPEGVCPYLLGYDGANNCGDLSEQKCVKCWNRPMEEVVE